MPSDELAIYLPSGQVDPPVNPYGRLIANAGTFRALARFGDYRRITVLCHDGNDAGGIAAELQVDPAIVEIVTAPLLGTDAASRAGTLLYGQPYLSEPAWVRRSAGKDAHYSIVGTIFAFASATHREHMLQSTLAPVHEWDALVCSSPTLATTVASSIDAYEDHLRERLGGDLCLPRPQRPVIPFGTDVDAVSALASDPARRAAARAEVGAAEGDVVVLFLGRLSYYDKAFPQPMLKTLELAQRDTSARLHFVMTGWFPTDGDRRRFEDAARHHAPTVTTTFLDGNDPEVVANSWAVADVFLLLSDTILETFGQAVVEAMAAGLPVVVSDWDGYRSIVREGVDGRLIPTLGAPSGTLGRTLALLQSVDEISYDQYCGAVAAHTAVSIPAAAHAIARLADSPGLRRQFGEAGRERARAVFDWPVVVRQYQALFAELGERRDAAPLAGTAAAPRHRMNPLRSDPFDLFAPLPSQVLGDGSLVTLVGQPASLVELDGMFPGLRGTDDECAEVVDLLRDGGPHEVAWLLAQFAPQRRPFIRMTVMWLAKAGYVDWQVG